MYRSILISFLFIASLAHAQPEKPKLVVGIVVDQMRNDYLQRFAHHFGEGGFNRLINDGFYARNNHYNYIPTYTAPGHASIYTGTTPKYHGIIGNDWFDKQLGRSTYCVGDTAASNLGGTEMAGNISPRNLLSSTITDELKKHSNFKSKVIGVSIKDRGAVLPAGHLADGAYWFDSKTGEFMTSDFYMSSLPEWVKTFNNKKPVDKYLNQVWDLLLPKASYDRSWEDNSPYEVGFNGKDTPTFPYDLSELRLKNGPYGLIRSTPFGNSLLLDLAKEAIKSEQLGKSGNTDFLAVSLSSTDYIGHNFGPSSLEIEDTYTRLDRDIASFLTYLDDTIGKGEYLIFLTADHGVVENPKFLEDQNLPGGFIDEKILRDQIISKTNDRFGKTNFIRDFSNFQLYLDEAAIVGAGFDVSEVESFIANQALKTPEIAEVYTKSQLPYLDDNDVLANATKKGYNSVLSGNIMVVFKPGYLASYNANGKGTSHGSSYNYDTHVPLLFFGTNVASGKTDRKTYITDIAPTIASLLQIPFPDAAMIGQPIEEAIK
ncbi:MAG: putative AlkP superfamily pyrophosphatase or phosphodiesterase [Marinoscillum sp.]|jgi:predicted AlkP superfamily pyrophosphatase or phosphodiesterase